MIAKILSPVVVLFCFLVAAVWYALLAWYQRWRRPDESTILPLHRYELEAVKVETRELGFLNKRSTLYVNPFEVEKKPNSFYFPCERAAADELDEHRSKMEEVPPETRNDANVEHLLNYQIQQLGHGQADQVDITPDEPSQDDRSGQTVFVCDVCAESFRTQGLLNAHCNRRHIDRYECSVCQPPVPFNFSADLTRHNAAKHPDGSEMKYYCTVPHCRNPGKAWTRKDHLKRHMRACERAAASGA